MDNCFLEKLLAKPGQLTPKFDKNIFKYNIILGVSDNKTTLDFFTEDSGASYQIFAEGGDGTKTICVDEGTCKTVKIEVTAEDGKTIKCYFIEIKRHSTKLAILESLKLNIGTLQPNFESNVFTYFALIGLKEVNIQFILKAPDSKCKTSINSDEIKSSYQLSLGCSNFIITVSSPDGSNKQNYYVSILRKSIPYYIMISNPRERVLYEDPISLSPCFNPVKTNIIYSYDLLSKREVDQLVNFKRNEFTQKIVTDDSIENSISNFDGQYLTSKLTLSESVKLNNIGSIIVNSSESNNLSNISYSFCPFNDNINTTPEWQNNLYLANSNENDKVLMKKYEEAISLYLQSRPDKPVFNLNQTINHEHPSKKLFNAINLVATAINKQKSESKYHFILAQLLEENYLNEDIFNLIIQKIDSIGTVNRRPADGAGQDIKAVITAKQDEILAICKLHGYSANSTDAEQLMALDKEYHNLISQHQTERADAIQNLFEWKSKQVSQEAAMCSQATNEETLFGQTFNKYLAALSLDKKSCQYNFHVGRLFIIQGKYKQAIERFHTALSSNKDHLPSKLCLGLAMASIIDTLKDKINESIYLIYDALQLGMNGLFNNCCTTDVERDISVNKLLVDEEVFFNIKNPLISKSIYHLGCLLMKTSQTKISIKPYIAIHWALHLATQGWTEIGVGNNLMQFEYTIIDCHKQLLLLLNQEIENPPDTLYVNRCLWLMNFIRSSSIPVNRTILNLLEEISQVPLYCEPGNPHFLTNYGEILSNKADQMLSNDSNFAATIELSIKILHLALDLNRHQKPDEAVTCIKDLGWYKENRLIIPLQSLVETVKPHGKRPLEINKTTPAVVVSKPTNTKQTPNTNPKKINPQPKKIPAKPTSTGNKHPAPTKEIENSKPLLESKQETEKSSVNTNKSGGDMKYPRILASGTTENRYRIELSLARAYRINKQYRDSVKYYKISGIDKYLNNINDMMQEYIETLISSEDYESALSVYYRLQINEKNPSFDDGYVCGEIVRLLMKLEKHKDKMLIKYASLWAKIFGLGIIEKEIKTLEDKSCIDTCREIYASVHGKKVDDPDLKLFFQNRCWI